MTSTRSTAWPPASTTVTILTGRKLAFTSGWAARPGPVTPPRIRVLLAPLALSRPSLTASAAPLPSASLSTAGVVTSPARGGSGSRA